MKNVKIIFIAIVLLCVVTFSYYILQINYDSRGYINSLTNKIEGKTLNSTFQVKIKSGNLSTDYSIEQVINDIESLKLNTLNVPIAINVKNINASDMVIDKASEEKAIKLIKKLQGKKINIILEPYPWIENGVKPETEWSPDCINDFFYNWKNKILKNLIDEVAIPYHVDAFNVGTSFIYMEKNEEYMSEMVDFVRRYYKGLITYRTNFWVTAEWKPELYSMFKTKINNKFFSKLDFISIAAYFELTENDTNSVENLIKALHSTEIYGRKQNVEKQISEFHDKWDKPIFFGELGFPRTNKASFQPYNPIVSIVENDKEQANCFEAYKKVFEDTPWNLGFSIFAIGKIDDSKKYYPSEDSIKVIKEWYSSVAKFSK